MICKNLLYKLNYSVLFERANTMSGFFRVFIVFFLLLPGFPAPSLRAGEEARAFSPSAGKGSLAKDPRERFLTPVLLLRQEDSSASALFASRIRQTIRAMLRDKVPSGANFSILPEKRPSSPGKRGPALHRSGGKLLLTIPGDFSLLSRDRETLAECASLALLAASSLPLRGEKNLRSSFLAAGLVRDGLNSVYLNAMPYAQYAPVATVLTSYGSVPKLKTLLAVPPPPESVSGELYGEYSFLLLSGLLRSRLLSEEDFLQLIKKISEEGPSVQYDLLHDLLRRSLAKRKNVLSPEEWFARYVRRELSSLLLPASPHFVEMQYISGTVLKGEDREGKEKRFPLTRLAEAARELKDPDKEVFRILQFLPRLARTAPGDLGEKLLALRPCIIRTRRFPTKENQLALNKAEQDFFLELEKTLKLEKFLRASEQFSTPPGARNFRTLEFLETFRSSPENTFWGSRLDALLDHTQNTFSDEERAL